VCGECGRELAAGTPVTVIKITGIKREFLRCEECASEKPKPKARPALMDDAFEAEG